MTKPSEDDPAIPVEPNVEVLEDLDAVEDADEIVGGQCAPKLRSHPV